ncbi:MAG: hypothetical protein QM831_33715 [Kofleriaceae bacterium]
MNDVLAAIRDGRLVEALELLLTAWRTSRAPEVADAIDRVSARLPRVAIKKSKSGIAKSYAWHDLADTKAAAALDTLLSHFADGKTDMGLEARVAALGKFPADPRIATFLAHLAGNWPLTGEAGETSLHKAMLLLVQLADVRTIEILQAIRISTHSVTANFLFQYRDHFITEIRANLRPSTPPDGVGAVLDALGTPTNKDELYDRVFADPSSDLARQVLADFLQQQTDPRGIFIAAQLAGKPAQAFDRAWLGPIEPALRRSSIVFERGFLAKCALKNPQSGHETIFKAREWATVTELDVANASDIPRTTDLMTRMPALRTITGLTSYLPSHPGIERAVIDPLIGQGLPILLRAQVPALRSLEIRHCMIEAPDFHSFWGSPLAQQLETFAIDVRNIRWWINAGYQTRMASFTVSMREHNAWAIEFVRGRPTIINLWRNRPLTDDMHRIRHELATLLAERDPAKPA